VAFAFTVYVDIYDISVRSLFLQWAKISTSEAPSERARPRCGYSHLLEVTVEVDDISIMMRFDRVLAERRRAAGAVREEEAEQGTGAVKDKRK
jgi:hypothetical protein